MEFLRTPDIAAAQRWSALTPASLNVASVPPSATPAKSIAPPPTATPATANVVTTPRTSVPSNPYFSHLDRADIKNSFQSLFSPNVASTPALLSRSVPPAHGLTPFINGMPTPGLVAPTTTLMQGYPNVRAPALPVDPVAHQPAPPTDALLSSPYLQAAAKEAIRRESLNMPSYVNTPDNIAHAAERVVPGNDAPQQVVFTREGVAVPASEQQKLLASPVANQKSPDSSRAVPQGPTVLQQPNKPEKPATKPVPDQQHMHPHFVHPHSQPPPPPPGMVMIGQHGQMMMAAPPPGPVYVPPPGMMMFPGSHGQPMMPQPGVVMHPSHPAARMVRPPGPPVKSESPIERKERIEVEKQELIREFKKKTREAALVRFRQKRRERRFGKLIRYDCRKKLADARPRVKGRFVRIKSEDDDESEGPQVVPNLSDL